MTINVTKAKSPEGADEIVIDLSNPKTGNDLNIRTTPEDARVIAEKILAELASE